MSRNAEADKYRVLTRLHQGEKPKDISDDLDISYSTVLRYKNELAEAEANNTVNKLMELSPEAIEVIGSEMVEQAPMVEDAVTELVDGVKAMQTLQIDFMQTAKTLSNRIRVASSTIEYPSELLDLTKAMCELQNAFFNKNVTQVNVQNNYDSDGDKAYGQFLNDKPGG